MASYHLHSAPLETLSALALFSTGAFIMRGAGCTINDLWDIKFDQKVARTRLRPLAAGALTTKQALGFLALQLSAGLAVLTQLNNFSIVLGAASLSLVVIYPFMKRVTYWPQVSGKASLAFNWGALLGWSAMAGSLDLDVTLPLYLAGVCWTLVYDTIYAHQDKGDDAKIGVKSTALLMASNTKRYLTGFSLATVGLLCASGVLNGHGLPFYLATVVGGGCHFAWQLKTVDYNCPKSCWAKFSANQQFGALVAFGIYADYLISCL
ncbi:Para-hydroxybenzoate--polyprenyltransferase, mitochondrial precursor (PHB:polyprenyltransferase) [Massospora cicadina]|nr:Para-hydroxybenzoate--polyprenyltransferase, mitochondrial precursor (PHB:polyprenyltransferase) [Massospora cicadina]